MATKQKRSQPALTVVIKLGTSSIIHETTHQPLLSILSSIVETVALLRSNGHRVVLVSSGAIGVGMKRMEVPSRPKSLSRKQALAAVGQGRLIALWDNLFGQLGLPIAQILLTRGDISDRTRYLNAVNTLTELLSMGVVPIVNENDTISVSEIKFGDNDTLSAITSSMIHADYLFLLTDVNSLYTSNPRKDPTAKAIEVVSSVAEIRKQVSTSTLGSQLGTGGMETKLIAADIATAAGVATVITSSKDPSSIFRIIEYNSPNSSPGSQRPPHTLFKPSSVPLRDLKSWTSHTLSPSGTVIIDRGAHHALYRRESGGRLLPAGVVGVEGIFAGGQAVRIVVRRKPGDGAWVDIKSLSMEGSPATQPSTPALVATPLTSSVSTIDPLSRAGSIVDAIAQVTISVQQPVPEETTPTPPAIEQSGQVEMDGDPDWEFIEIGRGLANYNSVEIDKVKGQKSSRIAGILGYADWEHVVENITIRVPP